MGQELGSLHRSDCPQSTFAVPLLTDELGAGEKEIGIIFLVPFEIVPWVLYFLSLSAFVVWLAYFSLLGCRPGLPLSLHASVRAKGGQAASPICLLHQCADD